MHRDLKPENIILTANGGVKVLDFGLAQFDVAAQDLASVTRLTDPGVIAGTPPYMAPEQLLGQATSARTDQFAFGVLLYEMLTGRHPFGSGGLPTTIAKTLAAYPGSSRDRRAAVEHHQPHAARRTRTIGFRTTKDLVAALAGEFPARAPARSPRQGRPPASTRHPGSPRHTWAGGRRTNSSSRSAIGSWSGRRGTCTNGPAATAC